MEDNPKKVVSLQHRVNLSWLKKMALKYLETLDRDKRIMGYRYVVRCKDRPKRVGEMGFLQFLERELDREP